MCESELKFGVNELNLWICILDNNFEIKCDIFSIDMDIIICFLYILSVNITFVIIY